MRLAISLVAALCTASALAQTTVPAFTPPRKIPAQGVSLTDAERAALVMGLATLERELAAAAVELTRDPRRLALLPDAEVFHKAVAWSLADDSFYSPKEIALARRLIETGRERVAQLRAGQAPWLQAKGLVVRGYRSQLDGSVQPYGLVVPEKGPVAGALQPMDPFLKLPEVTDPSNYRGNKLLWATTQGNCILLDRGTVDDNVWVNRDVLPASQFSNIDQLVSPALKGKMAIRSLDAPHGGSLTLAGFLHSKGMPWINQLMVDQQPQYIDNARLLTQNLINGKVAIAIGTDNPTLDQCIVAGGCKNLEQVRGYEYFLGSGAAVLKNAPHPNGTSVFLNWYFSKAGRESFMKATLDTTPAPYTSAQTIRKDVEPHKDAVASGSMPDYEHLDKYSLQGMEIGRAHV